MSIVSRYLYFTWVIKFLLYTPLYYTTSYTPLHFRGVYMVLFSPLHLLVTEYFYTMVLSLLLTLSKRSEYFFHLCSIYKNVVNHYADMNPFIQFSSKIRSHYIVCSLFSLDEPYVLQYIPK